MCEYCKMICNCIAMNFGHLPNIKEFINFIENSPLVKYDENNKPFLYKL